jgi:two-component system response regulator AtoC
VAQDLKEWSDERAKRSNFMVVVSNSTRNVPSDRGKFSAQSEKVRTRRVLIVDDELLIRWSLNEGLARAGFEVLEAEDARGALARFQPGAPDIHAVVLDLRLPDSADLTLLRRIRELAPDVPVIMMTAYGTAETTEGALGLGAWHVVSKPFDVHRVVGLVEDALK